MKSVVLAQEEVDSIAKHAESRAHLMSNPRNRTLTEVAENTFLGFVGEYGDFKIDSLENEWWSLQAALEGKTDDGGEDRDGFNIKTITPWDDRVYIKMHDRRARNGYKIMVFNPLNRCVVRTDLMFTYDDAKEFSDGGFGIVVSDLKKKADQK